MKLYEKYKNLNWSLSNEDLAAQNLLSVSYIYRLRRKYQKNYKKKNPQGRKLLSSNEKFERLKEKTKDWDWNLIDAELARKYNLTRERIRQIRLILNIPKTKIEDRRKLQLEKLKEKTKNWDWSLSNSALAVKYNFVANTVCYYRIKLFGKQPSISDKTKDFDWNHSNRYLTLKHNVSLRNVQCWRRALGIPSYSSLNNVNKSKLTKICISKLDLEGILPKDMGLDKA